MMTVIRRGGEEWIISRTRRGFRAECVGLEIIVTADSEAQLLLNIDEMVALLLAY